MDDAMMSRLLQSYGASNNAQNANRVREFAASNPEVLEHRAMGMRGSLREDNSDLLGPMLDKLIAQTSTPAQMPQPVPEQQPMPTVQAATAPTRRAATAAPAPQMGPNPPMATGAVNPLDAPAAPPMPQRQGSFWDDALTALLGVSSVAGGAAMRNKNGAPTGPGIPDATYVGPMDEPTMYRAQGQERLGGPTAQLEGPNAKLPAPDAKLPAPNKQLPNQRPDGNYESTGKEIEGVNARNQSEKTARKDVLQKEIDSENESNGRLQEQMRKRAREEAETADLVKKAKRAVGRK